MVKTLADTLAKKRRKRWQTRQQRIDPEILTDTQGEA